MSITEIKSEVVTIDRGVGQVFNFLCDLRNYRDLMPDEVVEFSAVQDSAELNFKGLGSFSMRVSRKDANRKITLQPRGKLPFDFTIDWLMESQNGSTKVTGIVNAKLNVFMKMMAEGRLKDFVSAQATKMKSHIENGIPAS